MEVLKAAVQPLADEDKQKTRLDKKSLKSEKRIVSGLEKPWYYVFYCGEIYFIFS